MDTAPGDTETRRLAPNAGERPARSFVLAFVAGLLLGDVLDPYPALQPWRLGVGGVALATWGARTRGFLRPLLLGVLVRAGFELFGPVRELPSSLAPTTGELLRAGIGGVLVVLLGRALPRSAARARPLPEAALAACTGAAGGAVLLTLARVASRAGTVAHEDLYVAWLVGVALVALGATLVPSTRADGTTRPVGLTLAALGGLPLAALPVLAGATSAHGFPALAARVGATAADFGTLRVDGALFAGVFVLPALALGAHAARLGTGLAIGAALAGAALAPTVREALFEFDATDLDTAQASLGSVAVIARAAALLGAVAVVRSLFVREAWAAAAGTGVLLLALTVPLSPVHVPHPWQRNPIEPTAVLEAPSGQYTLVRDGRNWSIARDHTGVSRGGASLFGRDGDVCVAEFRPAPPPGPEAAPARRPFTDDVAALFRRVGRDHSPLFRDRPLYGADQPWGLARIDETFTFELAPGGAIPLGPAPGPSLLTWLRTPVRERGRLARRSIAERLVFGADRRGLATSLRQLADLQRPSSPFELSGERVELDEDALYAFTSYAVERDALDPLDDSLAACLAAALAAQREVPWIYAVIEPIVDAHGPKIGAYEPLWALGTADIEELRASDAKARPGYEEAMRAAFLGLMGPGDD